MLYSDLHKKKKKTGFAAPGKHPDKRKEEANWKESERRTHFGVNQENEKKPCLQWQGGGGGRARGVP